MREPQTEERLPLFEVAVHPNDCGFFYRVKSEKNSDKTILLIAYKGMHLLIGSDKTFIRSYTIKNSSYKILYDKIPLIRSYTIKIPLIRSYMIKIPLIRSSR